MMQRRHFCAAAAGGLWWSWPFTPAWALGLADLTDAETSRGLKEALEKGAVAAVGKLGAVDGFLGNPKVKIPLPGLVEDASKVARMLGMGRQLDELVIAMNRAAEAAVPQAKPLLVDAVKTMTVADAKQILTGGETSVTGFFRSRTEQPLHTKFLPVVEQTTSKVGLARKYNDLLGRLKLGGSDARIEEHVTAKALDGLYYMIGQEEIAIRRDPMKYGSAVIGKVFGALK